MFVVNYLLNILTQVLQVESYAAVGGLKMDFENTWVNFVEGYLMLDTNLVMPTT